MALNQLPQQTTYWRIIKEKFHMKLSTTITSLSVTKQNQKKSGKMSKRKWNKNGIVDEKRIHP